MLTSKQTSLISCVVCVAIFIIGVVIMISDQRLKQRGTVSEVPEVCRLFMKDEIAFNAAPCDFILGTCIISCVIVVGITVSYDIFKLMTGVGDDQRLISFAMLGMHAVMTFLHLIIGIVAVVGFMNYCIVFGRTAHAWFNRNIPCSESTDYSSLMQTAVGAWIAFVLWGFLSMVSFLKTRC